MTTLLIIKKRDKWRPIWDLWAKTDQKGTSKIFKSSVHNTLQDDLNNINIRKKLAAGL